MSELRCLDHSLMMSSYIFTIVNLFIEISCIKNGGMLIKFKEWWSGDWSASPWALLQVSASEHSYFQKEVIFISLGSSQYRRLSSEAQKFPMVKCMKHQSFKKQSRNICWILIPKTYVFRWLEFKLNSVFAITLQVRDFTCVVLESNK